MQIWRTRICTDAERLTLEVKMHSTAAFLSMLNKDGIVVGGKSARGFNENTMRGHPLWLPLTTSQVTDVVMLDENSLCPKGGRHVPDDCQAILDPEAKREATRKTWMVIRILRCLTRSGTMPLSQIDSHLALIALSRMCSIGSSRMGPLQGSLTCSTTNDLE